MSKMKQIAVLSGLILAVGIVAAFASDASEWIMRPNHGYVIDRGGHVKIVDLKTDDAMTARAQEVPNGATFFMNEGRVMMYFDRGTPAGFFDR